VGVVTVYATLRQRADGERRFEIPWDREMSVGQVIRELVARKPGLDGHILDVDGAVVPYVSVFLDGRDIRYLNGLDTVLDGHSELAIFPPVAGG
jgi:molybdopterin synthase sulfur carrier subunit